MHSTPPLRQRLVPLVVVGFATALVRYAMEFVAPDHAMWFGLYWVMAAAIVLRAGRVLVDSAGTLCNAAVALKEAGAVSVSAYVTHGVLSGGAVARVAASPIDSLVITDSIQATEAVRVSQKIRQLTIAPLMGEAIKRITEERSVSSLFD